MTAGPAPLSDTPDMQAIAPRARRLYIYRYRKLAEKNFFSENEADTVIVFGGTNDSWSEAPLGEMKLEGFSEKDLFCALPAICYFMKTLKTNHPSARVIFIGNCDIKDEILDCMRLAAEQLGAEFVKLCGVDKINGHPTVLGMTQICEQIVDQLQLS